MFRNRLLKILTLLMVLNILMVPLTSFTPQQQNKYKVYAAEGIVDIRFFNAVISMIGITAAGLATMSTSFSIPEADLVEMKNNFAQSLEADAVKKQAWLSAQTDYLAGGIAKTMGAVELAKIGVNDIYKQFLNYSKTKSPPVDSNNINNIVNSINIGNISRTQQIYNSSNFHFVFTSYDQGSVQYGYIKYTATNQSENIVPMNDPAIINTLYTMNGVVVGQIVNYYQDGKISIQVIYKKNYGYGLSIYNTMMNLFGIDLSIYYPDIKSDTHSGIFYNKSDNILNVDEKNIGIIPTIPWIDNTVPVGTIVTPEIAAPYAGTVPIAVPTTVPIDPPIDEPVDPPVDPSIAGTVAAILAGLFPILGVLNKIEVGQATISDVITTGLTGVIDGIGDITGTLTGGITSSLTDIQTSLSSLLDPPTETLDLDKLKNLNSVLFTKFPFSIPFDFIAIVTAINADPVAPVLSIPFNMQDFGGTNSNVEIDLSVFDNIANIARQIGFLGFVIFMLFNTRKLIWK